MSLLIRDAFRNTQEYYSSAAYICAACVCDYAYAFSKMLTIDEPRWRIYRYLLCQLFNFALCLKIYKSYLETSILHLHICTVHP